MVVREKFNSQVTVDSTPSPYPWKNVIGYTTAPQMSSQWLRTLLLLAYPLSTALRPPPSRRIMESETWMLRLGSPGIDQLDLLPGNVTGIPPGFQNHSFRFIDWKEEARIQEQAAQRSAKCTTEAKQCYYMDFGFMRASTSDFSRPDKKSNRVVTSYDGFSSYLLIVDEASCLIWVFLTKSKAFLLNILDTFFARFGHEHGNSVRMDQGGELA